MNKEYHFFSKVYDSMQYDIDYEHWFRSLKMRFDQFGNGGNSFLELACGTGTLAIMFSKNGFIVDGLDVSEGMLEEAKIKSKMQGQILNFYHQDMVTMDIGQKYDMIYCMCDGFNYILDENSLRKSFENVKNHLNDGGLFIFDLSTHYKLSQIIGDETFAETFEDSAYIWENEYDKDEKRLNFLLTIFRKDKDQYQRFEEYHSQTSYTAEQVVAGVEKWFEVLEILDGDSFSSQENTSHRLCFVLRLL